MGFRLRKRIKVAPGIHLNLSKSGVSTSIGGRGHTVNLSKRGVRTTVGIPGTGLSYSTLSGTKGRSGKAAKVKTKSVTYRSHKAAERDAAKRAKHGWEPVQAVEVRRWRLFLLGHRTEVIVTYQHA